MRIGTKGNNMYLQVMKLSLDAKLPTRNNNDDAGYDLYYNGLTISLQPGEIYKFNTGVALKICREQKDFEVYAGIIYDRSSLAANGFGRLAGLIDQGYTGEIIVVLINHSKYLRKIEKGDKIAQIVYQKVETPRLEEVEDFENTTRGNKCFGSSGR